jgi:RHS repeat-associated protein
LVDLSGGSRGIHYYHPDSLGTAQRLTDEDGNSVWAVRSEAFGKTTISATAIAENNLRFPGQYYDAETSLHYNYFRDYNPIIGRYLETDPIGLNGGINFYAYVLGNPLIYVDADGLNPVVIRGLAAALAAARAAKAAIEKAYQTCKKVRCKIAIHGPHHQFGWPFNSKMCHVQLNCWMKGQKGSKFVLRFPYSCDFWGAPAAGAGWLPEDDGASDEWSGGDECCDVP